jgi:hypothetical protein
MSRQDAQLTIRLPSELATELADEASKRNLTRSDYIRGLLDRRPKTQWVITGGSGITFLSSNYSAQP